MSLAMLAGLSQAHQSNYRCRPTLSVAYRESTREPLRAPAAPPPLQSTQKSIIFEDLCMCILTLKIAGTQLLQYLAHCNTKASEEAAMRLSKGPNERQESGTDARGRHARVRLEAGSARDLR